MLPFLKNKEGSVSQDATELIRKSDDLDAKEHSNIKEDILLIESIALEHIKDEHDHKLVQALIKEVLENLEKEMRK